MSLVVKNAYRYPLASQRAVHEALRTNAEEITRDLVNEAVGELIDSIDARRENRIDSLAELMTPTMPKNRVSAWTTRRAEVDDTVEQFLRYYLLDYHHYVQSSVKTWPLIDTVLSWTYTWDTEYGCVVLHLPLTGDPAQMINKVPDLEPFSYDGRSGETDSATMSADDVADTWDRLVGRHSIGYAGATARLEGYELRAVFGVN